MVLVLSLKEGDRHPNSAVGHLSAVCVWCVHVSQDMSCEQVGLACATRVSNS